MKKSCKSTLRALIGTALMFAIGIGFGYLLGMLIVSYLDRIADTVNPLLWFGVMLLAGVGLLYLQIALHEAGHLVGGLASGYRFSSYRIGGLMLVHTEGGLKWRRLSIAGTGGQCLMAPPPLTDGRIPYRLYNLGGVLANLAATALFALLWVPLRAHPYLAPICLIGGGAGLLFALTNGIPIHTAQIDNDGYNALALGRDPAAMRAFWAQMQINATLAEGVRLHEMPAEWFDATAPDMHNVMCASIAVFACNRVTDAGQWAEADAQMAALLAADTAMVGIHRNLLICDRIAMAYILGACDRAESLATPALRKFMRSMRDYPSVIRTAYVLALLAGREEEADAHLARFDKVALRYPYAADLASERDILAAVGEAHHA